MSSEFNHVFRSQVRLLLEVLPIVMQSEIFALKGGTALNLFVRDLPRLSVDIDLTYLPLKPRAEMLIEMNYALSEIAANIQRAIPHSTVRPNKPFNSGKEVKLIVELDVYTVKIEPNYILRGCVFPPIEMPLSKKCEEHFKVSFTSRLMSFEDLYAGKMCAALDRQHPRDLFDIYFLLENEGVTDKVRQTFLVYLMSHNRPMTELLNPNWHDITKTYNSEFLGMSEVLLTTQELKSAGERLIHTIKNGLTNHERNFLITFKRGVQDWNDFFNPDVQNFPGIIWKQRNLEKLNFKKREEAVRRLEEILLY